MRSVSLQIGQCFITIRIEVILDNPYHIPYMGGVNMVDLERSGLPVTEQAKENFAKAVAKVIMSMIESGEAFEILKENHKAG